MKDQPLNLRKPKTSNSSFDSINSQKNVVNSSFRDPAGYVLRDEKGVLRRRVMPAGLSDFQKVNASGLFEKLFSEKLLVQHTTSDSKTKPVITPMEIKPITYPFEWSFSMLQDAALATLAIQKIALDYNMTLKDASAYNIQFHQGKPIFIDTLSFEPYKAGKPWIAYGQFCRHFLAPLALMAYTDIRLNQILREYLDGIPLDLAVKLLPKKTRLKPSLLMHLFMHAKAQGVKAHDYKKSKARITKTKLIAILESLERAVEKLKPMNDQTEWKNYYQSTNYTNSATKSKSQLVSKFVDRIPGIASILDLGGNDGHYSQTFAKKGVDVICADIDPFAVEFNYRRVKHLGETHMLPLLVDLINPGGALGWQNQERGPIHARLQTDVVLALALIHHLAISNNLPFNYIAEYLTKFGPYLIIEFVPKNDSQVQKLLSTRKDIFVNYAQESFEVSFLEHYAITYSKQIIGSKRTLYLLKRRERG